MSVIPDSRSALAGKFARALPTVDSVSNMSAHPVLSCPSRRSGSSFALMLVTAARELCLADATGPAESPARLTNLREIPADRVRLVRFGSVFSLMLVTAARELCLADATNPAESPARLTNLSAISAVRGRLARVGPLFALMSDTRAAEPKSLEGIAGMAA